MEDIYAWILYSQTTVSFQKWGHGLYLPTLHSTLWTSTKNSMRGRRGRWTGCISHDYLPQNTQAANYNTHSSTGTSSSSQTRYTQLTRATHLRHLHRWFSHTSHFSHLSTTGTTLHAHLRCSCTEDYRQHGGDRDSNTRYPWT